ncbi:DarT ssDNA thymidine ADP-ribosyltransferase family protein [Pseudomonas sp. COW5]|uniref:DarT ssDNA thymidine ADP-ribosyltransferase family protein n=1 Tax=Pseudomonas sp. COW5 TaxID=2981253 RepID=UPI002246893C|nr:DarT ssDNA thymidine ADP-ribosyltransferase family protein [Pseudomonas sp. COW5]MCX2544119.1 DUF4433 domain-containing protein [Pseudomonas sp. COW5]
MSDVKEKKKIEEQFLLYHLTSVENLEGIFRDGLKPRADLTDFADVADGEILKKRKILELDSFVPFHWFAKNPFDGRVQGDNPDKSFVLICVRRLLAQKNEWKIIPRHPLAGDEIELLEYDKGFKAIDWELMNTRDYSNSECKNVCMAECLSPEVVKPKDFIMLFAPNSEVSAECMKIVLKAGFNTPVHINRGMFRNELHQPESRESSDLAYRPSR